MKVPVRKVVIVNLVFVAIFSFVIGWYINAQHRELASKLTVAAFEHQQAVVSIASQGPAVFAKKTSDDVIGNCTEQTRHDELLGKLRLLVTNELKEARTLHKLCALHTSSARVLQAQALHDAVLSYADVVDYLTVVDAVAADEFQVSGWFSVVEKEKTIAGMLAKQSELQIQIIDSLLANDEARTQDLVAEARQLNDLIDVTGVQLSNEKEALLSI